MKEIEHPLIGPVTIKKNKRSKRMSIRVYPDGDVKIIIPQISSYNSACLFLESHKSWVLSKKEKCQSKRIIPPLHYLQPYYLKRCSFTILQSHENKFVQQKTHFNIYISEDINNLSYNALSFFKESYDLILSLEARLYLKHRISELSDYYGLKYSSITLRNNKSRWGSCTYNNKISLNIQLMKLPYELIDYVILHELVHTKIKNHSADFWNMMLSLDPDCKKKRKILREYSCEGIVI